MKFTKRIIINIAENVSEQTAIVAVAEENIAKSAQPKLLKKYQNHQFDVVSIIRNADQKSDVWRVGIMRKQ